MSHFTLGLTALVGLVSSAGASRTDACGDPLPKYAIARLGAPAMCHDGPLQGLAFSPDGKRIATVDGAALRLWDAATGKLIRCQRDKHFEDLFGVAFSPDGRRLAVGGAHCVAVYDAATGKRRDLLYHAAGFVGIGLQYSPDGKLLVARGKAQVCVWDAATGRRLHTLAHTDFVRAAVEAVAVSGDGRTLLTVGDNVVARWDLATGKLLNRADLSRTRFAVGAALTADGRRMAAWLRDGVLSVRDLAAGKELPPLPLPVDLAFKVDDVWLEFPQRGRRVPVLQAAFSPDGEFLATVYEDHWFVWHVATGRLVRAQWLGEYKGRAFGVSPGGGTLAIGDGSLLRLFDTATGKERTPVGRLPGPVREVRFLPDGAAVTETQADGRWATGPTWQRWDTATGRDRGVWPGPPPESTVLAVCGTGDLFAIRDGDDALYLWDAATGKKRYTLTDRMQAGAGVVRAAFSPDGTHLAAVVGPSFLPSDEPSHLHVWRVATGETIATIKAPPRCFVRALAFAADKAIVASVGVTLTEDQKYIIPNRVVWDIRTGACASRETAPGFHDYHVAISPDGRLLAVCRYDRKKYADSGIQVYELEVYERSTGRPIWNQRAAAWGRVAFSPDGRTLLAPSGSDVLLLDALSGATRDRLTGHTSSVTCLALARDGRTLLTGSSDHTALVWDVADLLTRRGAAPRLWTDAELQGHWDRLADADPAVAYRALAALAASPDQSPAWLARRLTPVPHPDRQAVAKHFTDLGDARFAVRQRAQAALAQLGEQLLPDVEQRLKQPLPLEAVRRLEQLRAQITPPEIPGPEALRLLRAVAALEHLGTPAAHKLLQALAGGAPGALTREAQAALRRLTARDS
jgi:WD40 repeat protein